jgi:hypothetical protein
MRLALQPRVHGLTFQRQHTKRALVNAAQRLTPYEAFQSFDPEREFA